MALITLCPNRGLPPVPSWDADRVGYDVPVNLFLQRHMERRDIELSVPGPLNETRAHVSQLAPEHLPLGLTIPLYLSIRDPAFCPPALIPLNECILTIAWEFNDWSFAYNILGVFENNPLESLITLFRSAAIYQAKIESVKYPEEKGQECG